MSGYSFMQTTTCGMASLFITLWYFPLNTVPFFISSSRSYWMKSPCLLLGQSKKKTRQSSLRTLAMSAFLPGTIICALSWRSQ